MISVVIPTRDRADTLKRTLAALAMQATPTGGFEVLVVDNGSTDETPAVVERSSADFPVKLRLLHAPEPGPAAARNRGVEAAQGEIVLFLGDDTIAADRNLVAGHASWHERLPSSTVGVLGRVEWDPSQDVTELMRWLVEESGMQFNYGSLTPGRVPAVTHFYTANVSAKRDLIKSAGGFDERFTRAALEDVELAVRLAEAEFELVYDDTLLVLHSHPTSFAQSLKRIEGVGQACALYDQIYSGREPQWHPPQPRSRVRDVITSSLARPFARRAPFALKRRAWQSLHAAAYDRGYRLGPPSN